MSARDLHMYNKDNNFGHCLFFVSPFFFWPADRYSKENCVKYEWTVERLFHMERLLYKLLQMQIES